MNRVSELDFSDHIHSGMEGTEVADSNGEKVDLYYTLWHRQRTEVMALRFLVTMQLLGIFVLSITIGCLLFRGY